jgi:DNA polymerase I-like protein with 3'-5' exonuclease and polymerase domains
MHSRFRRRVEGADQEKKEGSFVKEKVEYVYIDTDHEAQRAVDYLKTQDRLGYDTETTGLNLIGGFSRLLLMQLGTEEVTYLFDARRIDTQILREVLESETILKILHNAKFDYQSTKLDTGIVLKNVFDTMLAYRLLTSGLIEDGRGGFVVAGFRDKNKKQWPYKPLKFLTQKYLGITLDKAQRETFATHQYNREFSVDQLRYAAQDIIVLQPLCDLLGQELLEADLIDTALLEFQFVRPAAEMEMNGVTINRDKWRAIIKEAQKQADSIAKTMADILAPLSDQNTLFGESFINIKSPDQLLSAFQKLGFDLENTDEKALKKIEHPLAEYILSHRAYSKLISTYGEPILKKINRATHRLHFTLHQLGADTGRLSSENPNIQNIPQDKEDAEVKISFRECFEAAEGCKILNADYSQCELRILAEVSQDRRFLEIFRNDQDLHIITSQQVFGYTDAELDVFNKIKKKDHPDVNLHDFFLGEEIATYKRVGDYRNKTKTINFGIAYGLSAWSLAERFKIPDAEAEEILNNYFNTYSGIKRWLDKNAHETVIKRYAKTILGRKKHFQLADPFNEEEFRRSKGATRRMGNNHVIQGTNADITKAALISLQEAYDAIPGAKILFTVHDEIVSECPESIAEQVAQVKAEVMKEAFHRFIKTVPVGKNDKVSVTIANHWSK